MRVEMAAMKRDAEHYSRQVKFLKSPLLIAIFEKTKEIQPSIWTLD